MKNIKEKYKEGFWNMFGFGILIFLTFLGIALVALAVNWNDIIITFQMDDNTLEAIKSINWSALPE